MTNLVPSVVALATMAAAFWFNAAQAADRYGVACVFNKTTVPINFQAKVGNGQWQQFTLMPNTNRWFSHKYNSANQDSSPPLEVKFDSDLRRNSRFNLTYKLPRRAAEGDTCSEGKPYAFLYEGNNRNFIDLKAE
jgi:hypothetical protein